MHVAGGIIVLHLVAPALVREPVTPRPSPPIPTTSMNHTTTQPMDTQLAGSVARLVEDLRSDKYSVREDAQRRLADLGESAIPHLVGLLNDKDPEVARRVAAVVGKPREPALRATVAVKLLATTDPDWMERAVHMLFEDPVAVADDFVRQVRGAAGVRAVIYEPVRERLLAAKKRHDLHARRYERLIKEKPDAAEKERVMNKETDLYDAEAAYWSAYEAMLEYQENRTDMRASPSTRPATSMPTEDQP